MKRFQIYLEEHQDKRLDALARKQKTTKARIIREGINLVLRQKSARARDPLLDLIGLCDNPKGPKDASAHHDVYLYGKRR